MLDPTNIETGDRFKVSDNDSRYDGTEIEVTEIYGNRVAGIVEPDAAPDGWELRLEFGLDQLKRP